MMLRLLLCLQFQTKIVVRSRAILYLTLLEMQLLLILRFMPFLSLVQDQHLALISTQLFQ